MTSNRCWYLQSRQSAWWAGITKKGQNQTVKRKKKSYQKLFFSEFAGTDSHPLELPLNPRAPLSRTTEWMTQQWKYSVAQSLENPEVIPSISPFLPPPGRDHMKEMRDSWDPRYIGISEHLAPMQGHGLQITTHMTHWWQGDFQYSSSIWWKAVLEGERLWT